MADGGYDHVFLDEVPPRLICNICTKVLKDGHLTVCCGQHYCGGCLNNWSAAQVFNNTCPQCRKPKFESVLNKAIVREINELRIKCSHHQKGCKWIGRLENLDHHLKSNDGCGYVIVRCDYMGCARNFTTFGVYNVRTCNEAVERRLLAEHKSNCKWRPYICQYCGYDNTYDEIAGKGEIYCPYKYTPYGSNHYSICKKYPLDCPNGCGLEEIKRKDVDEHRKSCPLEPLDCEFSNVGCSTTILRQDMADHCKTNVEEHLMLMVRSHNELLQTNRELLQTNKQILERLDRLESKKK